MVYGIYNELVPGANLNQHSHHNGGPHIVSLVGGFHGHGGTQWMVYFMENPRHG